MPRPLRAPETNQRPLPGSFPDDVTDVVDYGAAVPPKTPAAPVKPVELPDVVNRPVRDAVRDVVCRFRPRAQAEDEQRCTEMKLRLADRHDRTLGSTHKRLPVDHVRFLTDSAFDLREVDRLERRYSGVEPMEPAALHKALLMRVRLIQAWSTDEWLLAEHSAACRRVEPALAAARKNLRALAESLSTESVSCLRSETPSDARWRNAEAVVTELQALETLSAALGTAKTRADAVGKALDEAGLEKVVGIVSSGMPFQNRAKPLQTQLAHLEGQFRVEHPDTQAAATLATQIGELRARLQNAAVGEERERREAATQLVATATIGDLAAIVELQQLTAALPKFAEQLRKARADDAALSATIGAILKTSDDKRAAEQASIAAGQPRR